MSGKNKSSEERLKDFERILDDYVNTTGLQHLMYHSDIEGVLSITGDELRGMTAEECGIRAFQLEQYAAFIQKQFNRNNMRLNWAESEIDKIVADQASRYGGTDDGRFIKYELLKQRVIGGDISAQTLSKIVKHAKSRVNELDRISDKIAMMGKSLLELQQTKRYRQNL